MSRRRHEIVIVSDEKYGCEMGLYVDGISLGITEGMLGYDLERLRPHIKGPFVVRYAAGEPTSLMHWPDDLDDVANLVMHPERRRP